MRAVKILGILIIIGASILVIAAFTASGKIEVRHAVYIKAPVSIIFSELNSWQSFREWNPWREVDPDMQVEIEGPEEMVGSIYRWKGKKVGEGQMKKTFIRPDSLIEYQVIFYQPWGHSVNRGYWLIEPDSSGSRVTWVFSGNHPFLFRMLRFFFNLEEKIEKDFDRGLHTLKEKTETILSRRTARPDKVYEIIYPKKKFMLLRHKKLIYYDLDSFRNAALREVFAYIALSHSAHVETPHCIVFDRETEKKFTNASIALPIAENNIRRGSFTSLEIPESTGFAVDHFGSYDSINHAHLKLQQRIELFGYTHPQWIIEEYIARADNQPDTSKWHTRIYYLLR